MPRGRRGVLAVVIVVLLVAVVWRLAAGGKAQHRAATPPPPASATAVSVRPTETGRAERPSPAVSPSRTLPKSPTAPSTTPSIPPLRLIGPAARDTGIRLLVMSGHPPAAARARIFALDSEHFTPVRGLPPGGCLGGGTRVPGTSTWVIEWQPTPGAQLCVGSHPGSRYLIDAAGNARRLGASTYVVPAGDSSFWTVSGVDLPPDQQVTTSQRVQRVSISGRPLSRVYRVPVGWTLLQGLTPDLLLLARELPTDGSRNWALWRPSTGGILDRYDRVLAAGPKIVAWVADSCAPDRCPVHLSPTSGRRSRLVALPRHAYAFEGSLSDDGHFLALNLGTRSNAQNATSQDTGAVFDLGTYRLHLISQTKVPASEQDGLTLNWAGPRWLMAGTQGADGRQLAAYNPTTGSFVVAGHDLPAGAFPVF